MNKHLFSLAVSMLVAPGILFAGDFLEEWAEDSPGATGAQLTGWLLANGSAPSVKVVNSGGVASLVIDAETFAHLRTRAAFPAGEKIVLGGRVRLDPEKARAGAGFGIRSEALGPPAGYEVRLNPTLGQIFVFRVEGDQEKQLLARPFPNDKESHDIRLVLDRSGAVLGFVLSVDGVEAGSGTDANPVELGGNVRPYLMSRGGTEISYEKIELGAP